MINLPENVKNLCAQLYDKKAKDIVALYVADQTIVADWFIICSGRVPAQTRALCDDLEDKAAEMGLNLRRKDGHQEGHWIVLDYADILVHIFLPQERQFYNMERLWDTEGNMVNYSALRDEEEDQKA